MPQTHGFAAFPQKKLPFPQHFDNFGPFTETNAGSLLAAQKGRILQSE